jgi:hypothetical protein
MSGPEPQEVSVRKIISSAMALAGVLLVPAVVSRDWSAAAAETVAHIENAPCGWFSNVYPGAWGTDHKILINRNVIIERMSFARGMYQLADGTDAYDFLEKRCGRD